MKLLRRIIAILSITAVSLLFLDFTGTARSLWPWLAKVQFMPALLSVNIVGLFIIVGMTLLLGRIYCSVICPLGIFQDVISWVGKWTMKKKARKNRFRWAPARSKVRLGVLTVFVILVVLGLVHGIAASIAGLIEPYSAYGRIATQVMAPAYDGVNNLLTDWSASQPDNYMFYRVVYVLSIPLLAVAVVTLLVLLAFAWRGGRDYCNTICPVGTILGYMSKYSLFKMTIDTGKCIRCGKCARRCKAKCIDSKNHAIDYTRCVVCFDCIDSCSEGAIKYTLRRTKAKEQPTSKNIDCQANPDKRDKHHDKHNKHHDKHRDKHDKHDDTDKSRRGFVSGVGFIAGALAMHTLAKTTDGGLAPLKQRSPSPRKVRIVPAGAKGLVHMSQHCTACQLCVQACPTHILKPTMSFDGFMQPSIEFVDGYCLSNCTRCSDICPTGAIEPIDDVLKSSIKVGTARVDLNSCISAANGTRCGNCSRHCPAGAVKMLPVNAADPAGHYMPVVNDEACIGCGACEYYCPVGTMADMAADSAAIHVEGIERHRTI